MILRERLKPRQEGPRGKRAIDFEHRSEKKLDYDPGMKMDKSVFFVLRLV